jgi:hypothetical protein
MILSAHSIFKVSQLSNKIIWIKQQILAAKRTGGGRQARDGLVFVSYCMISFLSILLFAHFCMDARWYLARAKEPGAAKPAGLSPGDSPLLYVVSEAKPFLFRLLS